LKNLNQPTLEHESDNDSWLKRPAQGTKGTTPLLAAALKSKHQFREEESVKSSVVDPRSSDPLKDTNQPQTQYEDDEGGSLSLV
jgi:hypothetical protein